MEQSTKVNVSVYIWYVKNSENTQQKMGVMIQIECVSMDETKRSKVTNTLFATSLIRLLLSCIIFIPSSTFFIRLKSCTGSFAVTGKGRWSADTTFGVNRFVTSFFLWRRFEQRFHRFGSLSFSGHDFIEGVVISGSDQAINEGGNVGVVRLFLRIANFLVELIQGDIERV